MSSRPIICLLTTILSLAGAVLAQTDSAVIDGGVVTVDKRVPTEATIGEQYTVTMTVRAKTAVTDVLITDEIPTGAGYVRSEPAAHVDGNALAWHFAAMAAGDTRTISITLLAKNFGDLSSCATVKAVPACCLSTMVGRPGIDISVSSPDRAPQGSTVTHMLKIHNPGTALTRQVVITTELPDGLEHDNRTRTQTWEVGELAAGARREITTSFTAIGRGSVCNTYVVNTGNTGTADAKACTEIFKSDLTITQQGPQQEFLNKPANYTILLKNPGDIALADVVVTSAPVIDYTIIKASDAKVTGRRAVWTVKSLPPGTSRRFEITMTSSTPGTHCSEIAVTTRSGLSAATQACTMWQGLPALLLDVTDTIDPLVVGGSNTFTIRVTNQGTAAAKKVFVAARLPAEIAAKSTAGDTVGKIDPDDVGVVFFTPHERLEPGQTIEWTITTKSVKAGDARTIVQLHAEHLGRPVTEEESTRVY